MRTNAGVRSRRLPAALGAVLGAVVLLAGGRALRADTLTAKQIVDKSLQRNAFGFEDADARVTLQLFGRSGSERTRQIEIRSVKRHGLNKTLVRFLAPADVAGTGFLVLGNKGRDDDQYLYLPALGKVKRITGGQRHQRFMGTDLTYADLESNNLRKSISTRLPDASVGGNPTYVIQSIPKDRDSSQYGKTISWIHEVSFVPLKIEFYDKFGKLLKTLQVKKLAKKDGRWVVMDSVIENVQSHTKTHMTVNAIDFGVKLPDDAFTERALKAG